MAPLFPAILIGGPAHSGKSTLTYRLSETLRRQGVPHYALRASPDGDGDWSSTAPEALVAELRPRARSAWSAEFARAVAADVAARHLPLLVDAGGLVTPETRTIAGQCTHALLLAADPAALTPWRALMRELGLAPLAELRSALEGPQVVEEPGPPLRGVLSGLGRGRSSEGPCFAALTAAIARLCAYTPAEVYRSHLALTDIELVLHVERAIHPLPAHGGRPWEPGELPTLLASLPPGEPLGIYGRGPNWLYAALAAASAGARCAVFDPRQGWVELPSLAHAAAADEQALRWEAVAGPGYIRYNFHIAGGYLDRRAAALLSVPAHRGDGGVVLSGRLPLWLWAALARSYRGAPWVACYQPQLAGAVVVAAQSGAPPPGACLALA